MDHTTWANIELARRQSADLVREAELRRRIAERVAENRPLPHPHPVAWWRRAVARLRASGGRASQPKLLS